MYSELYDFFTTVGKDRRIWRDGDFITAATAGVAITIWGAIQPQLVLDIRAHFGDLLSATSIVFGFVLTTLFFYIQAASTWSRDPKVTAVAKLLVDHHAWGVVSFLALLGYILFLWTAGRPEWLSYATAPAYGLLAFLVAYCGFQVLNQVLTIRWVFNNKHLFGAGPEQAPSSIKEDVQSPNSGTDNRSSHG